MYYIRILDTLFLENNRKKSNFPNFNLFLFFSWFNYQLRIEVLSTWKIVASKELLRIRQELVYVKDLASQGNGIETKQVRKNFFHSYNWPTTEYLLKLIKFDAMTVKFHHRQPSLPSFSVYFSTPASTFSFSCHFSIFRRPFAKNWGWKKFFSSWLVASNLNFQSSGL